VSLPAFIPPMLATLGEPFSDPSFLFEIKWDGMRTLAYAEGGGYRAHNRKGNDVKGRYPELAAVAALPEGTVVDGELTVMRDGMPSFNGLLQREQARGRHRIAELAAQLPATYIVFDLLYHDGLAIMDEPLTARRAALQALVTEAADARLVFSEGVEDAGEAFFERAVALDLEGVVAKKLNSRYLPGRRTKAWVKFKKQAVIYCVIIGYFLEGDDLRSLVVATEEEGALRSVGRVGSGLDDVTRARLKELLGPLRRDEPVVPSRAEAVWVEPRVFCTVKYLERTPGGELRAPVFVGLVDA
jgi:bifunctional non-homologous end joining protein LigD